MADEYENDDCVTMSVPLLLRAMEWAREDAPDDMALHFFAENAVAADRTLTMQDYAELVKKDADMDKDDKGKKGHLVIAIGMMKPRSEQEQKEHELKQRKRGVPKYPKAAKEYLER